MLFLSYSENKEKLCICIRWKKKKVLNNISLGWTRKSDHSAHLHPRVLKILGLPTPIMQ